MLLLEETAALDSRGRSYTQARFLRMADNLLFAADCFGRIAPRHSLGIDSKAADWKRFQRCLAVRHRVTHSKHALPPNFLDT
jgi:hypothetical protein